MNIRILLLLTCALLVGGCASDKAASDSSSAQQKQKDPEVGMTKDQIVAMYGKTDNVQVSSEGETWIYHLNMGEAFIHIQSSSTGDWSAHLRQTADGPDLASTAADFPSPVEAWEAAFELYRLALVT